jgi:hypothetical protein
LQTVNLLVNPNGSVRSKRGLNFLLQITRRKLVRIGTCTQIPPFYTIESNQNCK